MSTARKGACYAALAENEQPLVELASRLLDSVGFVVTLVDHEGRILEFNQAAETLSGYAFEDVAGRYIWEALLAEGSPEATQACFRSLSLGYNPQSKECAWLTRSGERRILNWNHTVFHDRQGRIAYVLAAGTDVTARRDAEARLQRSEEQYRRIVETTGVIPYDYDYLNGRFHYIGPQTQGLLGYTTEQWSEPRFWERNLHPEDRDRVLQYTADHVEAGTDHQIEYRFYDREGRVRWIHDKVSVVKTGGEIRLIGIVLDITERKAAELRLAEAQQLAVLGSWEYDARTGNTLWSEEKFRLLGCNPRTCHPSLETYLEATLPEDRPKVREALEGVLSGRVTDFALEHSIGLPDGETRILSVRGQGDYSVSSELLRIIGTAQDVTERRRQEAEIQRAAQLMHAIYSASPDMIFLHGEDGRLLDCNDNAVRGYGYSREELLALPFQEICGGDCTVDQMQAFVHQADGGNNVHLEWIGRRRNGEEFPVDLYVRPLNLTSRHTVAVHRDVTDIKRYEVALKESETRFRSLYELAPEALLLVDMATMRILDANANAQELFGRPRDALIGKTPFGLSPTDLSINEIRTGEQAHKAACEGKVSSFDWRHVRADGQQLKCRVHLARIPIGGGYVVRASVLDVTARHLARQEIAQQKERLRVTLEAIADAVVTTDANGVVNYLNPEAAALTQVQPDAAEGLRWDALLPLFYSDTGVRVPDFVRRAVSERTRFSKENITLRTRKGQVRALSLTCAPILLDESVIGAVLVLHDVTETQVLSEQLAYLAHHDMLTGLPNRVVFETKLEAAVREAKSNDEQHVLCFIDMDQFKIINDAAGHAAGDELIKQVSGVMRRRLRSQDLLARIGGDEFGLLLSRCALADGRVLVEELLQTIRRTRFVWEGRTFEISASIGMVGVDINSTTASDLMRQADAACYIAKDDGRNRLHTFIPGEEGCERRRSEMGCVHTIREALRGNRFELFVQAINAISGEAERPSHYEVLLRLRTDTGELVAPISFLPAAERYGLMPAIDRWVVDTLAQTLVSCEKREGELSPRFAVNLAGPSLGDEALLAHIERLLSTGRLDPHRIIFEITETAAIANMNRAAQFIDRVTRLGCQFALDDFGSGLSSFAYLKSMRVAYLKIDGVFIHNLHHDAADHAMVEAIHKVGHSMGLKIIAEGVEKSEIIECLRTIGIDYMQGFAVAMPRPLSELTAGIGTDEALNSES